MDYEKVRDKILEQNSKTDNEEIRAVLMMLLLVLEHTVHMARRIETKIDGIIHDDEALRARVLKDYADIHHKHHEFVDQLISEREESVKEKKSFMRAAGTKIVEQSLTILLTALAVYFGLVH